MARATRSTPVDRAQAGKYLDSARTFLTAAIDLAALAGEDESYGAAVALLSIHSVISHADAVLIASAGRKSTAEDHGQVVKLLRAELGARLPRKIEALVTTLVSSKDSVAYQGKHFDLADAKAMLRKARSVAEWAMQAYQRARAELR